MSSYMLATTAHPVCGVGWVFDISWQWHHNCWDCSPNSNLAASHNCFHSIPIFIPAVTAFTCSNSAFCWDPRLRYQAPDNSCIVVRFLCLTCTRTLAVQRTPAGRFYSTSKCFNSCTNSNRTGTSVGGVSKLLHTSTRFHKQISNCPMRGWRSSFILVMVFSTHFLELMACKWIYTIFS